MILRLGIVSDVHIGPAETPPTGWHNAYDFAGTRARLSCAVEHFNRESVDHVVLLGDLTHRGDQESLDAGATALASSTGRLWAAPGNHDAADLRRTLGVGGADRVADAVRMIVLDIEPTDRGATFCARNGPDLASWGDDLTFFASHYPLVSRATELAALGLPYPGDLAGREHLLRALVDRPAPTIVLSGHLHIRDSTAVGPVLQLFFPALVEHPFECSILQLGDHEGLPVLQRISIPLHSEPFVRNPVFSPAVERWEFDGTTWLSHQFVTQEALL
jgi:Calcineurin-like phosphoesterase